MMTSLHKEDGSAEGRGRGPDETLGEEVVELFTEFLELVMGEAVWGPVRGLGVRDKGDLVVHGSGWRGSVGEVGGKNVLEGVEEGGEVGVLGRGSGVRGVDAGQEKGTPLPPKFLRLKEVDLKGVRVVGGGRGDCAEGHAGGRAGELDGLGGSTNRGAMLLKPGHSKVGIVTLEVGDVEVALLDPSLEGEGDDASLVADVGLLVRFEGQGERTRRARRVREVVALDKALYNRDRRPEGTGGDREEASERVSIPKSGGRGQKELPLIEGKTGKEEKREKD
ncbi:hypothetical protein BJ684DRAFT_17184 [Piptocephalis cylindrospora]|uniref:Uncharacterized protein n=1 Tax=Piptocephalis cylindrospora TaxID=1907219 RepID=A0A4P9Y0P9_9FUNG|nr:hypothetical protein BJ684DRAFT_17184 [Piptocephalis cylindrospora]|eukprot:RKP12318.1 hypothetical protein BJ684DRAFT_17184 [Piptocephalis cylindrospora]